MMMKKLLIFMLVLCMASAANAGLQISVHTDPPGSETWDPLNPTDSEITVAPSDYLWLDVHATGGDTGAGYWALIVDTSLATITGGRANIPPAPDMSMFLGSVVGDNFLGNVPVGHDGVMGAVDYLSSPPPPFPDGVYFDEILFHCEGEGDVEVLLGEVNFLTWEWTGVIIDSIIIHQIPEPMTVLLLGLGGLFLRRRR